MASAGNALRAHIEGLLTGSIGTGYTLDAGRFHLVSPDETAETHPLNSVERAVEVVFANGEPIIERNPFDGFDYVRFVCNVLVVYPLTKAGGDLVEGLTEQNGASTLQAIRDRALTDYLDVVRVMTWPDNRGSTSPSIMAIIAEDQYAIERGDDRVIATFPFRIDTVASTTSAFAP